jgi:hypothetical protein
METHLKKIKEEEKIYWENHYSQNEDASNEFFCWFDETRFYLYGAPVFDKSLEIGPGNGNFSKLAGINVVVDFSSSALHLLLRKHPCKTVLGDNSRLPFKGGSFKAVYTNDVLHHLKAQGILEISCNEIKRVLSDDGYWFVSDRLPTFQNSVLLFINRHGKKLFVFFSSILGRDLQLSGSDHELPMTDDDYRIVKSGMIIQAEKKWRSSMVFLCFVFFLGVSLFLPDAILRKTARFLVHLLRYFENNLPSWTKNDVCLAMKKDI